MGRNKITVVGAGNVGATTGHIAAGKGLGDIVLLDILEGFAEGKALDISQAGGVEAFDGLVSGTTDWGKTADSDIVIVTSGFPRKAGMSRDEHHRRYFGVIHLQTAAIGAEAYYLRWPDAHRPETLEQAAETDRLCAYAWNGHPRYALVNNADWDWLDKQAVANETQFLRHVRLAAPLLIRVDGRRSRGVIHKI